MPHFVKKITILDVVKKRIYNTLTIQFHMEIPSKERNNMPNKKTLVAFSGTPEQEAQVLQAAKTVYRALDCHGFARVDLFCTPDGRVVFNEVNTIPGFTAHSRFPSMFQAAGLSFSQMIAEIIRQGVSA